MNPDEFIFKVNTTISNYLPRDVLPLKARANPRHEEEWRVSQSGSSYLPMCEEDGQGKARSLAWREVTGWAKRGGNLLYEVGTGC